MTSPLAWYIERENAEEGAVALAMEESQRLLEAHATAFAPEPGGTHVSAILEKDTGSHFDPAVMNVFLPMARHA